MSPDDYYKKIRAHFKDILPDGLDKEILQYFSNSSSKISFNFCHQDIYLNLRF